MPEDYIVQPEPSAERPSFELVTAGTHTAILAEILLSGERQRKNQDGTLRVDEKDRPVMVQTLQFVWQIVDERHLNDEPKLFFQWVNESVSPKSNLGKLIQGWVGFPEVQVKNKDGVEGWNLSKLLGRPARIAITHEPRQSDPSQTVAKVKHEYAVEAYTSDEDVSLENYTRPGKFRDMVAIGDPQGVGSNTTQGKPRAAKMALPEPPPQVEEEYTPFRDDELPE